MVRRFEGIAIDCDNPECMEVYSDTVSISLANLRKAARRDGWMIGDDDPGDRDLCPHCFEAEQDRLYDNPPQDEGDER
jgi:hypothetical protein